MWLSSVLSDFFYRLSDTLYPDTKKLWFSIGVGFAVGVLLTLINAIVAPITGHWALNLLSAVLLVSLAAVFFLIQCLATFHRLKKERGTFQNHSRQELVYSVGYTVVFGFLVFALVFFTYAIFASDTAT